MKLRLKKEKALHKKIFPSEREIFKAFELTSPEKTKVIILGQDPYHNPNQANGLCFSVKKNQALPPSLKNIYKEIEEDLGIKNGTNGDLSDWAKQGVLLINNLNQKLMKAWDGAVRKYIDDCQIGIPVQWLKEFGWEEFTDHIIKSFNKKKDIVFMLWGKFAVNKKKFINQERHFVLEASHPSPLSCYKGFFGCKHFSKCNAFLKSSGRKEINWKII